MAQFPAFPLWTDAYLGDTHHLTTIEHGAYLLLLITMWRSPEKRLPDDDKLLARYARLTSGQWTRMRETIRSYFDAREGHLYQGRLTDEAEAVRQLSKRQSKNSKARWLKNNNTTDPMGEPRESLPTPTPTPTPNNKIPTTSGADGATEPEPEFMAEELSDKDRVWKAIPWLMERTGEDRKSVAGRVGKFFKTHDPPAVLEAIEAAYREHAVQPIDYVTAILAQQDRTNPEYWEKYLATL